VDEAVRIIGKRQEQIIGEPWAARKGLARPGSEDRTFSGYEVSLQQGGKQATDSRRQELLVNLQDHPSAIPPP
jgi:hypothetical protein